MKAVNMQPISQKVNIKKGFLAAFMIGIWIALLWLSGDQAFAKTSSSTKRSLSLQLYNASGSGQEKRILAQKKKKASLVTRPRMLQILGLSEEHIDVINGIYSGAFQPNAFYGQKLKKITRNFNRAHVSKSIRFFRSGIGRKVVSLNNKALKASPRAYQNFLQKVIEKLPKRERLELLSRLEIAIGSADLMIDLEASLLQLTNPVGREFNAPNAEVLINRLRSELREQIRSMVLLRFMFDYRSLSNRELKKLIQFYESSAGQWFKKVEHDGNMAGFATINRKALRRMEKLLKVFESGRQSIQTTRAVFAPGLRYLFSDRRDPFEPLVIPEADQPEKKEAAPAPVVAAPRESSFAALSAEIESIPAISYELYQRVKETNPRLYSDLEYYGALFKNKKGLGSMKKSELQEEIDQYKSLLKKAKEETEHLVKTPLQASLGELKLAGVIWDEKETVGLIETADTKGHTIRVGSFVGPEFGVVQSISEERVVVLERLRKYDGKIITQTQFIEFPKPDEEE